MPQRISLFNGTHDPWPKALDVTADTLAAYLISPVPDDGRAKDAYPLWSPAVYPPRVRRAAHNVEEVHALVADVDDGTPVADVIASLRREIPGRIAWHSSFSSAPEHPKHRVVVLLERPIAADLYPRAWAWFSSLCGHVDPACKDASRAYFVPVARPGFVADVDEGDGSLFDLRWETLPERATRTPLRPPEAWRPTPERPEWSPAPADYPPETVAAARAALTRRIDEAVDEIAGLASGRRTAIRNLAYHLARYSWLGDDVPDLVRARFASVAVQNGRYDENIAKLLDDCIDDAAGDPAPIEDLLPRAEGAAPPAIVKYKQGFWVQRAGGPPYVYEGPFDGDGMVIALRDRGDLPYVNKKGNPWPRARILDAYGVNATAAELVYPSADGSIVRPWDASTTTLRITRAATPYVEPQHHADVEEWLVLLLSEAPAAVARAALDWLATVHRTDAPRAALYLDGPPGAGKGLLATALASPWRTPPVPLEVALGDFPAPLARCPIVWLDEGTDLDARGTARFRSLVSERSHQLNEKHAPLVPIIGCVAVVVTANNADALGIREIRSIDDLDAIAERVLHVPVSRAAADYLARTDTTGWVTAPDGGPGRVAEHIAHLARTRTVRPAGRWLVAGVRTEYHTALLWRVPEYAAVLGGILVGLDMKPAPLFATNDDGTVSVPVATLHARWSSLVLEDRARPTMSTLVRILGALSREHGVGGVWRVDAAALRSYAAALGAP